MPNLFSVNPRCVDQTERRATDATYALPPVSSGTRGRRHDGTARAAGGILVANSTLCPSLVARILVAGQPVRSIGLLAHESIE